MTRQIAFSSVVILLSAALCSADTFKHRPSGDLFHGFATQKSIGNRTRVYNAELESFKPINLAEYDVTPNAKGRRNSVVVIPLNQGEVLLSKVVSEALGNAIVDASNKGPKFIVLEIDSPGGRGQYMKDISTTITKTRNCPLIAFVNGGKFGGAYSAAAAVALACDKIYISPDATMGAVAPLLGSATGYEDGQTDVQTYSSKNLSAYNNYIAVLAEKNNRPSAVAMAMVDRNIEVIEVTDKNGQNRALINRTDKRPNQTVVRTWARDTGRDGEAALMLTPSDAVYSRMADKVVNSLTELLADMGTADAKLIKSGQVDKTIRKFLAARRNLSDVLTAIDYLQKRADQLEQQLNKRETQERESTVQREYRRGRQGRERGFARNSGPEIYPTNEAWRRPRRRSETEIVTGTEPVIDTLRLRNELSLVLTDLIRAYNRAVGLARRWPGALPMDMTLQALEKQLVTATALQNDVVFRRGGAMGPAGQFNRGPGYNR
ncbi:MAG: Clp protease/crotonase-like domain-containing protein [Planctomycetota bacterium]|jgi:ClpP class serine protease